MSNINNVSRDSGPRNEPTKKKKAPKDPDAFKQLLQVDKIDPDEQSKRRRSRQEERDTETPWEQIPSTSSAPASSDTSLFSLVAKRSSSSTDQSSSTENSQYNTEPPSFEQVLNSLSEDNPPVEEEPPTEEEPQPSFEESLAPDTPAYYTSQTRSEPTDPPPPQRYNNAEKPSARSQDTPTKTHASNRTKTVNSTSKKSPPKGSSQTVQAKKTLKKPDGSHKVSPKKKMDLNSVQKELTPTAARARKKTKTIEKKPTKIEKKLPKEHETLEPLTKTPKNLQTQGQDKEQDAPALSITPPKKLSVGNTTLEASSGIKRTSALSPRLLQLLHNLSGLMTIMQKQGKKELSIILKGGNPLLHGVKITLTEWSSAPCQFNISMEGSPEAIALLEQNVEDLAAAFNNGKFSFKVHQITTSISQKTKEGRQTKQAITKSGTKKDTGDQGKEE